MTHARACCCGEICDQRFGFDAIFNRSSIALTRTITSSSRTANISQTNAETTELDLQIRPSRITYRINPSFLDSGVFATPCDDSRGSQLPPFSGIYKETLRSTGSFNGTPTGGGSDLEFRITRLIGAYAEASVEVTGEPYPPKRLGRLIFVLRGSRRIRSWGAFDDPGPFPIARPADYVLDMLAEFGPSGEIMGTIPIQCSSFAFNPSSDIERTDKAYRVSRPNGTLEEQYLTPIINFQQTQNGFLSGLRPLKWNPVSPIFDILDLSNVESTISYLPSSFNIRSENSLTDDFTEIEGTNTIDVDLSGRLLARSNQIPFNCNAIVPRAPGGGIGNPGGPRPSGGGINPSLGGTGLIQDQQGGRFGEIPDDFDPDEYAKELRRGTGCGCSPPPLVDE